MEQKPILPPDKANDPANTGRQASSAEDARPSVVPDEAEIKKIQDAPTPGYDPRIERAVARVDRAEGRTERAEVRTAEAKVRTEQAEARTQQAETRIEQAETRIGEAEARTEQAKARTEEAKTRTEQAEARTEEAKTRTEQAETRTEQAETRSEQAETKGEQASGNSELKYRRLFEAARDGILILDADTGRINDVNPFLIKLLGFSHAEMAGKTVGELSPSKDIEWNKIMLSRLQKEGYVRYEDLPLETKDGRRVAVEFVSNVYEVGRRQVIQCNIRDITQRKHAEMASSRLAAIVESSDDAIIGKDLHSDVSSWNKGAERIFGYTADEMVGTSIRRLIPDDRQDENEQHLLGRIKRGESVEHFETKRRSKDGRMIDVSITASPIRDDTSNVIGVSIIARDITARRKAETSLSESQANMAAAQRIAHIGSWELDLTDRNDIDANALRWSDEMFHIAGYEPGAVAVTNELFFSLIPEAEHAPIREAVAEAIGGRERYSIVHQLIRPDGKVRIVQEEGKIFWGAETGRPARIVGTAHDITDQRKAEEVLRESERRLREMLENVELIAVILDKDGTVEFCNDYVLRLTGWKREEVLGHDWFSNFIPEASPAKAVFFKAIEAGDVPAHYENTIKTRTGELREIAWNNTMLRDRAGKIVGTASLGEDVTERNRAAARHLEQEEAKRANRAKSEFLSRMSHELRTPLHAILGFAQLLEMDGRSAEDAESLGQIVRAGKHLLGLINEVLDLAAVEAGKLELTPEPVRVTEALGEVLSLVKPLAAARGVRIVPLAVNFGCEVLANERRFKQVILNLLSNAVKFNREGGAVTVSYEKIEARLRIKVADTGRGISPSNLAKLFAPFERLDEVDTVIEGSGLGLSLSKRLIEAMGGSIGVESAIGTGSTFWVELPLVQRVPATPEQTLEASPPSVAQAPRCTAPRTLLYIEDNPSNLRLVERILARRPEITLLSAGEGSLGLELARQHLPDLVLLDLHLPEMQGDEILLHLRADPRTAQIPIVMVSADAPTAQIERLRAAGANDYLTKPIDVRNFLALVDATEPRSARPHP
ncbi:MAG: hypothetical protein QOE70_5808 [Chthoniobacter sp.]|jgi:PAS domain S-box-containing protein|nr:hypothetical protein [Chthoniobacter sp.]